MFRLEGRVWGRVGGLWLGEGLMGVLQALVNPGARPLGCSLEIFILMWFSARPEPGLGTEEKKTDHDPQILPSK